MIKLYNSLSKQKEMLRPIKTGEVSLYVCGMTVYDYCHIGHGRIFVVYDAWVKFLRSLGLRVNYVRNITDVDDKIIARAQQNNESCEVLTQRFIQAMHEDEAALGVARPDHEPQATHYIEHMIQMIQELIAKDCAYVAGNGDVCFSVQHFQGYGKLSHRNLEELHAGARIDIEAHKRNPLDFVLWKLAKPGEPSWSSPWGEGRPGWHIECSAMSGDLLGQPFDLHGGGVDLKFPHHENEVAQSESAHAKPFVNIWMHVGHVHAGSEKMSKSLGNFLTIREALAQHSAESLRYFMLSGHYRSPIQYSDENLSHAHSALTRLYTALRGLPASSDSSGEEYRLHFQSVLEDDFNTPEALAVLFEMARDINTLRDENRLDKAAALANTLRELGAALGFLQQNPDRFLQGEGVDSERIEALIQERIKARQDKDWARADQIRQALDAMNIVIEDNPQGTLWRTRPASNS